MAAIMGTSYVELDFSPAKMPSSLLAPQLAFVEEVTGNTSDGFDEIIKANRRRQVMRVLSAAFILFGGIGAGMALQTRLQVQGAIAPSAASSAWAIKTITDRGLIFRIADQDLFFRIGDTLPDGSKLLSTNTPARSYKTSVATVTLTPPGREAAPR